MANKEMQGKLDIKKWLDSESKKADMCGTYDYCAFCDICAEDPCANAYEKMEQSKQQQLEAEKKAAAAAKAKAIEIVEPSVRQEIMSAKKQRKQLCFIERLAIADEAVRTRYVEVKEELMKDKAVKSRLSERCESFRKGRKLLAKFAIAGKGLRIYLAIEPATEEFESVPHTDVSRRHAYSDVPFMFRITSKLAVKRAKLLIAYLLK